MLNNQIVKIRHCDLSLSTFLLNAVANNTHEFMINQIYFDAYKSVFKSLNHPRAHVDHYNRGEEKLWSTGFELMIYTEARLHMELLKEGYETPSSMKLKIRSIDQFKMKEFPIPIRYIEINSPRSRRYFYFLVERLVRIGLLEKIQRPPHKMVTGMRNTTWYHLRGESELLDLDKYEIYKAYDDPNIMKDRITGLFFSPSSYHTTKGLDNIVKES